MSELFTTSLTTLPMNRCVAHRDQNFIHMCTPFVEGWYLRALTIGRNLRPVRRIRLLQERFRGRQPVRRSRPMQEQTRNRLMQERTRSHPMRERTRSRLMQEQRLVLGLHLHAAGYTPTGSRELLQR
jgi:hypothetical protein